MRKGFLLRCLSVALRTAMLLLISIHYLLVQAFAATILSEDFESYQLDTFPNSGGWHMKWDGAGSKHQFIDDENAVSGSKSLHLVGSSCWSANVYHSVAIPSKVSLYVNILARNTKCSGCSNRIAPIGLNKQSLDKNYGEVLFHCDGNIYASNYANGKSNPVKLMSYNDNTWYQIRIDYDFDNRSSNIYIDGKMQAKDLGLYDKEIPDSIELCAGHGSSPTVWFDDVFITSNKPPKITSFTADPTAGTFPLDVSFQCTALDPDGSIIEYRWDFGDSSNDVSPTGNCTHTYPVPGTYNARVSVVDNEGTVRKSTPIAIKVNYGPELTGMCERYLYDDTTTKASMRIKVVNNGDTPSGPFRVAFHLSDDGTTPLDPPFKRIAVGSGLEAGETILLTPSKRFENSIYGKYILIYIDSSGEVHETDETNNGMRMVIQPMLTQ